MNARLPGIVLSCVFLIAFSAGASCDSDDGYLCTVEWKDADEAVVGETMYDYPDLGTADEALAQCMADQVDDPDRPDDATGHQCTCGSK